MRRCDARLQAEPNPYYMFKIYNKKAKQKEQMNKI